MSVQTDINQMVPAPDTDERILEQSERQYVEGYVRAGTI